MDIPPFVLKDMVTKYRELKSSVANHVWHIEHAEKEIDYNRKRLVQMQAKLVELEAFLTEHAPLEIKDKDAKS